MGATRRIRVSNHWDARMLLGAFADRGSFLIPAAGDFEVHVSCGHGELVERLAGLAPTVSMSEATVLDPDGSARTIALACCAAASGRTAPGRGRSAGVDRSRVRPGLGRSDRGQMAAPP